MSKNSSVFLIVTGAEREWGKKKEVRKRVGEGR